MNFAVGFVKKAAGAAPVHLGVHLDLNATFARLCSPDWLPIDNRDRVTRDESLVTCKRCLDLIERFGGVYEASHRALSGERP